MKIENDLGRDNIKGLVLRLAIPSMLAQFVNVLYSIVDRMYIGNIKDIGEVALAGVGICSPIVTIIIAFSFLVGAGGAPIMSIKLGEGKEKEAESVLANCFMLLSVFAIVLMGAAYVLKDKLLMWFGASEVTYIYANEYISIYLLGTVFALLAAGLNQFIICQGYAKKAMVSVVIGAMMNIILDPILMFGFGMGVKGAALATVIAQFVSCCYVLWVLFGNEIPIRITFGNYSKKIIGRILLLGLSPFLIIASDSVIIIVMNAVIQSYGGPEQGDQLLTCTTIIQSFMIMVIMPLGGITAGTQTILGYNYGAMKMERVKQAQKYIIILGLIFTTIMLIMAHVFSEYFVRIFTQNTEYIELSVRGIKMYTLAIIPLALQYAVVDGLSGMGLAQYAIFLSMFRKAIFLIGILYLPIVLPIEQIFLAQPLSDIISAMLSGTFYLFIFSKILRKREAEIIDKEIVAVVNA